MSAIYFLWLRELKRYVRSRAQIAATLGQPLVYLLALGYGLTPVFRTGGQGSYIEFLGPGVIAMTVLFSSMFSGMMLIWDRQFGCLKATLVTPLPRVQIMIGRTCGAATTSLIQGLLVALISFAAGFRPVSFAEIPLAIGFLALIALVFTALGSAIGSTLKDLQGFQMVMNLLVTPLFFLSGALFPLEHLLPFLTVLTAIDPLSYGVDGLRGTLTARTHFGLMPDLLTMAFLVVAASTLAAWRFSRVEI